MIHCSLAYHSTRSFSYHSTWSFFNPHADFIIWLIPILPCLHYYPLLSNLNMVPHLFYCSLWCIQSPNGASHSHIHHCLFIPYSTEKSLFPPSIHLTPTHSPNSHHVHETCPNHCNSHWFLPPMKCSRILIVWFPLGYKLSSLISLFRRSLLILYQECASSTRHKLSIPSAHNVQPTDLHIACS